MESGPQITSSLSPTSPTQRPLLWPKTQCHAQPAPAGRPCIAPASSSAKQMKPNSQRPANAQWASVKGSDSPCFAWTTTGSESYCPRWRDAPPSHLPTGPLGSCPLHRDQAPCWPGHPHRAAGMGATAAHLSYTFSTERLSPHPTRALFHSLNKCQSFASAPGSLLDPGGTAADKELTA